MAEDMQGSARGDREVTLFILDVNKQDCAHSALFMHTHTHTRVRDITYKRLELSHTRAR
jgi:hypothetical protein